MWPVEFHDEAEEEAGEATDWYAARNLSAMLAFGDEIRAGVASIASDPSRHPTIGPERYFYLMKRFPYLLVYRIRESSVQILAVAHTSRRPGYWKHRE